MRRLATGLAACGLLATAAWADDAPKKKPRAKLDLEFLKPPKVDAPPAVGPELKGQVVDDKEEQPLDHPLAKDNGPALLAVAGYVGKDGSRLANNLVRELRQRLGLKAYVFRFQEEGDPQFRQMTAEEKSVYYRQFLRMPRHYVYQVPPPVHFGVMVGDFQALENDRNLDRAKVRLLNLGPNSLSPEVSKELAWGNPANPGGRPYLLGIHVVANPLRPKAARPELSAADLALLRKLNAGGQSVYTLGGKYSICLYRFQGYKSVVLDDKPQKEAAKKPEVDGLTLAAENAEKLCAALRKTGCQACTFHGMTFSAVCMGAYNSADDPRLAADLERARTIKLGGLDMQPEPIALPALFAGALRAN